MSVQTLTPASLLSKEHDFKDHSAFIPIELRCRMDAQVIAKINDPYNLDRYVSKQETSFRTVVKEIKNGKKESHWFWYILPTDPYVVVGVEQGSRPNQHFALRSDEEVKAFLKYESKGVNLRRNYITILTEIKAQLKRGKSLEQLFPPKDVPKAIASFNLFKRIARETHEYELFQLCTEVLALEDNMRQKFNLFQRMRNKMVLLKQTDMRKKAAKRHTIN